MLHKESNRALTLQTEFAKMDVDIEIRDDLMMIKGGKQVKGAIVTSHNDHRIAMACAVAALGANGDTTIHAADAVKKSYPAFFEDLKMLKASAANFISDTFVTCIAKNVKKTQSSQRFFLCVLCESIAFFAILII